MNLKPTIMESIKCFVPKKRVRSRNYPKWFTPEICHNINKLRSLRRKLRMNPTENRRESEVFLSSNLEMLIQNAKISWESKLVTDFANSNNQKIYSHIKSLSSHASLPLTMSLAPSPTIKTRRIFSESTLTSTLYSTPVLICHSTISEQVHPRLV